MTSIGPATVVSMGTDTVVHLRLSPTQNPVQKRGNSTDTLPLSLTKQVQLYDRPSSRKTALEARFPGTFVAIYSRPPILVAWNFPLTSMKLYECCSYCPLTSMHPRRLRTEQQQQQKTWGFPVAFSIIIVHKVHLKNVNSRVCVTQTSCFCVSSINQTKNQTKLKKTHKTSTNTFHPNLCKSSRGGGIKGKFFPSSRSQ